MVAFFERHTSLQFIDGNKIPDIHGNPPGAALGGRSVCAAPFDGRAAWPADPQAAAAAAGNLVLSGMGIAAGADLGHFLNATRSRAIVRCMSAGASRRHLLDLLRYRRGMQLVNGNALAARLGKSAADLGVRLLSPRRRSGCCARRRRARAPWSQTADGEVRIRARRGVVLACGGFPHDVARKRELFPHAPTGQRALVGGAPLATPATGFGSARQVGGVDGRQPGRSRRVGAGLARAAPRRQRRPLPASDRASEARLDRRDRKRPTASSTRRLSYHDFVQAHAAATAPGEEVGRPGAICDHRFIRRYGLGCREARPAAARRRICAPAI